MPTKKKLAVLTGEWGTPLNLVIVAGEEEDRFQSEDGLLSFRVWLDEEGDEVRRMVTLEGPEGVSVNGEVSIRGNRVTWKGGAVWVKQGADLKASGPTNRAFVEEGQHSAGPGCCSWGSDEVEDGGAVACCGFFGSAKPATDATEAPRLGHRGTGRPLQVEIMSAHGLHSTDFMTPPDAFATCEVEGLTGSFAMRTPIHASYNPCWNHEDTLNDFVVGDTLLFTVWDKDTLGKDFIGKATLRSEQFWPDGFEGELQLSGTPEGVQAFVTVDVAPKSEQRDRKHMLSSQQVEDIVERINDKWDTVILTSNMEAFIIRSAVQAVNRRLRSALLSFSSRGWVNAISVLMDEEKDTREKKSEAAQCLKEVLAEPLVAALRERVNLPGVSESGENLLWRLIVNQIVREVMETIAVGIEASGMI